MKLGSTGLIVSRVGYGTAALGRSLSARERLRLVETAFDCGVTHFDTAPLYGAGAAETALGRFLAGGRDRVTIATKVGIRPPSLVTAGLARALRRPGAARGGLFAPAEIRASLASSLRRLRTSHVDLLLLHEVDADRVNDDVLAALDDLVRHGDVRAVGSATSGAETARLLSRGAPFPAVVQVAAADTPLDASERGLVLHSAIAGRPGAAADNLAAVAARHPSALLLFGSRSPEHVRETAAALITAP